DVRMIGRVLNVAERQAAPFVETYAGGEKQPGVRERASAVAVGAVGERGEDPVHFLIREWLAALLRRPRCLKSGEHGPAVFGSRVAELRAPLREGLEVGDPVVRREDGHAEELLLPSRAVVQCERVFERRVSSRVVE